MEHGADVLDGQGGFGFGSVVPDDGQVAAFEALQVGLSIALSAGAY